MSDTNTETEGVEAGEPTPPFCDWFNRGEYWTSSCGTVRYAFTNDAGPMGNGMTFCFACGRRLGEAGDPPQEQ